MPLMADLASVELSGAARRTVARYAAGGVADRYYVRIKLATDPVVGSLAELGPFGNTIDAGAGRGQMGLFLLEAGLVSELTGFDCDRRKVAVAEKAANGDASFAVGDVGETDWPMVDTVLMIDVLHYVPPATQADVVLRAARALRPGGRLLIRESDARARGSWITRVTERLSVWTGYNEGRGTYLEGAGALRGVVESTGLRCSTERVSTKALSDFLLVGHRPH